MYKVAVHVGTSGDNESSRLEHQPSKGAWNEFYQRYRNIIERVIFWNPAQMLYIYLGINTNEDYFQRMGGIGTGKEIQTGGKHLALYEDNTDSLTVIVGGDLVKSFDITRTLVIDPTDLTLDENGNSPKSLENKFGYSESFTVFDNTPGYG